MCQCNGNVDVSLRSSCDESTGICQNCLYNTAGDHCESCKNGYYGNASNHDCKRRFYFLFSFIFLIYLNYF